MKAKIWNTRGFIDSKLFNDDNSLLKSAFHIILKASGFNVLNNIDHNFKPFGYSTVWLLAESHFAIHTFPEENKIYYELSSCNEEFYKRFNYNLRTYFKEIKRKWEKAK